MHEADLTRKYDCTQLDVVELRAVYGAVKSIRWRDVKGHADGRAAWRKAARDRLVALVDRERRVGWIGLLGVLLIGAVVGWVPLWLLALGRHAEGIHNTP